MAADSSPDSAAYGAQRSATGVAVHRRSAPGQAAQHSRGALTRHGASVDRAASFANGPA